MEFFDIDSTEENLISSFRDNKFGRNKDILGFVSLLNSFDRSSSIALDAQWGAGKTFFVKQTKMVLDAYNPNLKSSTSYLEIKAAAEKLDRRVSEMQPFVTIYYDAWLNDNDVDPILSLVYSILKSVDTDFSFKENASVWDLAVKIGEELSGKKIDAYLKAINGTDLLKAIKESKNLEVTIHEFFESLILEKGNRLVIFVDELDRCNPEYAVKFLERIKHYFLHETITFVFSVNIGELQHAIKHHYGNDFDACKYLDRFFDLRLGLPPANLDAFYNELGLNSLYFLEKICKSVIEYFNLSIRETAKYYRLAKTALYKSTHNDVYFHDKLEELFLYYICPFLIGLKLNNQEAYMRFINGLDGSPLFDFHEINKELGDRIIGRWIPLNEIDSVDLIKKIYNAVYKEPYIDKYMVTINGIHIEKDHKGKLDRMINTFSNHADYEI